MARGLLCLLHDGIRKADLMLKIFNFIFKPCPHTGWRDIYGDEINARNCRSICRLCGKRSQKLMNVVSNGA